MSLAPPTSHPAPRTDPVVIVGGGVAGLSAAVTLADAGVAVTLLEEAPRLGGRASSFTDKETGDRVDNGQHVLFGCYRATYAFLERIGTADRAPLDSRLRVTMAGIDGRAHALVCPAWPPPWHLLGGVLAWRALSLADRLSALRLAGVLRDVRRLGAAEVARRVPASATVSDWLAARGQSRRLCEWLWRPLAVAALNQSPDEAAAAPFVRVIGELFGPRVADSAIGMPAVPLDELFAEPAVRLVRAAGGDVRVKSSARVVVDANGAIESVETGAERIAATTVISTVPWHALGRLWKSPPAALLPLLDNARQMASSPIVSVNLWFDRPVMPQPFMGLIGMTMQWAFDRSRGPSAAAETPADSGHIAMVASGATGLVDNDNSRITAIALHDLNRAVPRSQEGRLVRSVVVREHRATWSLAPGGPSRPGTRSALAGFYLAGDWTDTGLPGTIESAVLSGRAAAAAVLADRGIIIR